MVTIRKMSQEGRTYYYLEHPVKVNGRPRNRSKYIGTSIPENIEELKREFLFEIDNSRWEKDFRKLRLNYMNQEGDTDTAAAGGYAYPFGDVFTSDSLRISGSGLTLREVSRLVERGIVPKGRSNDDIRETIAHHRVFQTLLKSDEDLSLKMLTDWHWNLFRDTKPLIAGIVTGTSEKSLSDSITGMDVTEQLDKFFRWCNDLPEKVNPVMLAGLTHARLYVISPFKDGNGRIGRLAMNYVLHRNGFPMINIEFGERKRYLNSLYKSRARNDEREFLKWFFLKYRRKYSEFI